MAIRIGAKHLAIILLALICCSIIIIISTSNLTWNTSMLSTLPNISRKYWALFEHNNNSQQSQQTSNIGQTQNRLGEDFLAEQKALSQPAIDLSTTIRSEERGVLNNTSKPKMSIQAKEVVLPARTAGVFTNSDFERCKKSNCIYRFSDDASQMSNADIVAVEFHSLLINDIKLLHRLPKQPILLVYGMESPGYLFNHWKSALNNFNGSMTYHLTSTIYSPYGGIALIPTKEASGILTTVNYARNKTKGAYAYVSNCNSMHYNRLHVMRQLSKYIDVDIYGGCTRTMPCNKDDTACELPLHSKYRFYLAFENSLCEDYITEKFWKALQSSAHVVPVAIGGLVAADYTLVAPPNSFIHAYDFPSIADLGRHLHHLMEDDTAYNKYHEWRKEYKISSHHDNVSCDICELAHNKSLIKFTKRMFADEWNDPSMCMQLLWN